MRFEWDDRKRALNHGKHFLDFADAEEVFAGRTKTFPDTKHLGHEQRFLTLGLLKERVVLIAHTETADTIRVISMRKATRREQTFYFED